MADIVRTIAEFAENVALLIALTFLCSLTIRRLTFASPATVSAIIGFLFGAVAFVGMQIPVHVADGIIIDGRNVLVMLAAPFGGTPAGLIAGAIVAGYRFYLGGAGMTAGVGAILSAMLVGLVFRLYFKLDPNDLKIRHFLAMALVMTPVSLAWIWALPASVEAWPIFQRLVGPVGLMYPLTALILGLLLIHEYKRIILSSALADSEKRFRDFAEVTSDWFWETDAEGRYTYLSGRFSEITGLPTESALGRTARELGRVVDEAESQDDLSEAIARRKPYRNAVSWRTFADGSKHWVRSGAVPILDDAGAFAGWRGTSTDITRQRESADQLRQAQKMDAVGQLTSGVAHDFNNVLAIVMGNMELLADRLENKDDLKTFVEPAVAASEHGAELTQRLLAFARKQTLEVQVVDLRELARGMEHMLARVLEQSISIEFVESPGLWRCEVDPGQVEQAILNLAINARDAMPKGGKLTIEMANARLDDDYAAAQGEVAPGNYVMLAVSDSGCGMSPQVKERIFEPFYTTKDVGKGTGLGLSMVFGFVKQSGGHITVYSEEGIGTAFKLYFPKADAARPDQASCRPESMDTASPGESVLVVEDQDRLRELVERMLVSLGYRVVAASSASAALALVSAQDPPCDLMLTDVILPGGMNGRELADAAEQVQPGLKILYMSGYTDNAIAHHGRLDADAQLLRKPFTRRDLARKIRQALDSAPSEIQSS